MKDASAADFVTALRDGKPRDWSGSRVIGDVDLSAADIRVPVKINNVSFDGSVNFAQTRFARGVDLRDCRFAKELTFTDARVEGPLRLDGIVVGPPREAPPPSLANLRLIVQTLEARRAPPARQEKWRTLLEEATRNAVSSEVLLNLEGARIEGSLSLWGARVMGSALADFARIEGTVIFDGCTIHGDVSMQLLSAKVVTGTTLRVDGELNLRSADISGDISLHGATIDGAFSLLAANVGGNIICQPRERIRPRFRGSMFFHLARVKGAIDCCGTRVLGDFVLEGAEIGGFVLCSVQGRWTFFVRGSLWMAGASIKGSVTFEGAVVRGRADLAASTIGGGLLFRARPRFRSSTEVLWLLGLRVRGDLDLDGIRVRGNLVLQNADIGQNLFVRVTGGFRPEIAGTVFALGLRVHGSAGFGGARIDGSVLMNSAAIDGDFDTSFDADQFASCRAVTTHIAGDLDAELATLGKRVSILGTSIDGNVKFTGAQIGGAVFFYSDFLGSDIIVAKRASGFAISAAEQVAFEAQSLRMLTHVRGDVSFQRSRILGGVTLAGTGIGGAFTLRDASVRAQLVCGSAADTNTTAGSVDFETLEMVGDVSLSALTTRRDVSLRDCSVKGTVSFGGGTIIGGQLRLDGAEITELVFSGRNLPAAEGDAKAPRVVLARAKLGRLRIDGEMPASLDIRNMRADRLDNLEDETHLDLLARSTPFEKSNYLAVENALRNAGRDSDADAVHVRMRREDRKLTRGILRRAFDKFLDATIRYGTNSRRVALAMLLLFIASVVIFSDPRRVELDIGPSAAAPETHVAPPRWSIVDAVMFTTQLHVPIISLGVDSDVRPRGTIWRIYSMIVVALHWIMWPLLIASMSGFVRKRA